MPYYLEILAIASKNTGNHAKIDGYNERDNFLEIQTKGLKMYKLLLEILVEHNYFTIRRVTT